MKTFLQHWNIVRIVRLVLGILMVIQSFSWQSLLIEIGGGLLMGTALLNIGCLGGTCAIQPRSKRVRQKEVTYEEVDALK